MRQAIDLVETAGAARPPSGRPMNASVPRWRHYLTPRDQKI
ncbi:polyprenyl synthetase domain protein [Mycobacterium ulcerans str. Harvey]|uniref:Polyprenyl synthetase domain protein n=1 Tax=Mycobacterium ulcerans str. Harvey TaxID=1299332 RepID=A0ABP3ADM4_MYCUL|nr:polyprenyl synthetase domain protein [Mycobacterium ulcerans str. Harvey]